MGTIAPMDIVVIICYSTVCISCFFAGIFLLLKSRDKAKNVRNYLIGIALFFILYGIARVIMFMFELTFPGDFVWNISVNDFDKIFAENRNIAASHDIVWRLTTGLGTAGVAIFMYELERVLLEKKSKYILTLITIVTVIPALILGVEGKDEVGFVRIILYVGNFLMVAIPLIYLYITIKTSGETRKRAMGAMIGIFIFFWGIIFNSSIGKTLFEATFGITGIHVTYILFGTMVASGMIIFLKSLQY